MPVRPLLLVLVLTMTGGCLTDPVTPANEARLVLEPGALDVGPVYVGETASRTLTLRNDGSDQATELRFTLEGDDAFVLEAAPDTLLGDAEIDLVLRYQPETATDHTAVLRCSAGEADTEACEVTLTGRGVDSAPEVVLVPETLDVGVVEAGCRGQGGEVCAENRGEGEVRLMAVSLTGDPGLLLLGPFAHQGDGQAVPPGEQVCVVVRFGPEEAGVQQGDLALEIAPAGTLTAQVVGEGAPLPAVVETFALPDDRPRVDVLFVIDPTSSMADEQDALRRNLQAFAESALEVRHRAWVRIGVITTDVREGGLLRPIGPDGRRWVDTETDDDLAQRLVDALAAVGATAAEVPEAHQGLESARLALSEASLADPDRNAGFIRDGAHHSVVFVSDGADASPSDVDAYLAAFWSLEGPDRKDLFGASAIVSDAPACESECGAAEAPGDGYLEVQQRTGGLFESVCACAWSLPLGDPGCTSAPEHTWYLAHTPRMPWQGAVALTVHRPDGTAYVPMPRQDPEDGGEWWYGSAEDTVHWRPHECAHWGYQVEVKYLRVCPTADGD